MIKKIHSDKNNNKAKEAILPVSTTPIENTTKGSEKPLISNGTVSLRYTPSGKLPLGCDIR